jgi:hypothetical protein
MKTGYTTVFEVSYFNNLTIIVFSALVLFAVTFVGALATVMYRRMAKTEQNSLRNKIFYFRLIILICLGISSFWFASNIYEAYRLTDALRSGQCDVVEGVVRVLGREPGGVARGSDSIRIAGHEFAYSSRNHSGGYNQTISHGGVLEDGVMARLHYLGPTILQVEIKH